MATKELFRNIILTDTSEAISYSSPIRGGGKLTTPERERVSHGATLKNKLENAWVRSKEIDNNRTAVSLPTRTGMYLEFVSAPNSDLNIKSLEDIRAGIRLLNVKEENLDDTKTIKATVYIPSGKESHFIKKITEYIEEDTPKGRPKNSPLINSIEDIKLATIEGLWSGKREDIPGDVPVWCEVWLRVGFPQDEEDDDEYSIVKNKFIEQCGALQIPVKAEMIRFPERAVMLIRANNNQLKNLIESSDLICEFRRAAETAEIFTDLSNFDQGEWIEELLGRLNINDESNTFLCILDTGINNGHKLISPVASDNDLHTYNKEWGKHDDSGHGTEMAGIAIYCNLEEALLSDEEVFIPHKIESVKILPPRGENDPDLYGYITGQAISLVEIERPNVNRIICMAVTSSKYNTDNGSPTSWSASIDEITSGYSDDVKRLFIVSGGNVAINEILEIGYPECNELHSIESPGQSWNAVTVGAYTEKILIQDDTFKDYKPLANPGDLSPFSSTSLLWDKRWPLKPEILCEGGNVAVNNTEITECDDLSLLTTSHNLMTRSLTTIRATSSAAAQASWIAAQISSEYPEFWPETIRALLIHSAEWTESMKSKYIRAGTKREYYNLLRSCGYGVPNLERALSCARNSVNLIIEDELQPYNKLRSEYKMNEMHLHELPWPKDILLELGETEVNMRVTLSYFIEPSPGEIGWQDRYRYASCGLRFDVNNVNESNEEFQQRINRNMRDEDYQSGDSGSQRWRIGSDNRHLGSIHSDVWSGTAAQLCESNFIAIYPTIGWWRERPQMKRWNRKIRYSLIVTINTPEESIDLYTPILNKIESKVEVENRTMIEIEY